MQLIGTFWESIILWKIWGAGWRCGGLAPAVFLLPSSLLLGISHGPEQMSFPRAEGARRWGHPWHRVTAKLLQQWRGGCQDPLEQLFRVGTKPCRLGGTCKWGLQTPLNKELKHSQTLGCPGQVAGLVALAAALKAVIYTKACLDSSGAAARTSFGLLCHVFKIFQHL